MSYGIHVDSTNGKTLIDQDFINYVRIKEGSASVSGGINSVQVTYINLSSYTSEPKDLIFVKMESNWSGGGIMAFPMGGSSSQIQISSFGSGTLSYRIYREIPVNPASSGYGLEVYRSNGTSLAFSSNYKVPRIFTSITGTTPFESILSWTGTQPFISGSINATFNGISSSGSGGISYTTAFSFTDGTYGVRNEITSGGFTNFQANDERTLFVERG